MTNQDLHDFYRRFVAALNARNLDFVETLIHHDVLLNGALHERGDVIASLRGHIDAVPDFTWHIEALVIEGDQIAAKMRDTGTPVKTWLGLAPNGAAVTYNEYCFYKVRDGRFAEMSYLMDIAEVARQLAT